jgi:hypothetical protein
MGQPARRTHHDSAPSILPLSGRTGHQSSDRNLQGDDDAATRGSMSLRIVSQDPDRGAAARMVGAAFHGSAAIRAFGPAELRVVSGVARFHLFRGSAGRAGRRRSILGSGPISVQYSVQVLWRRSGGRVLDSRSPGGCGCHAPVAGPQRAVAERSARHHRQTGTPAAGAGLRNLAGDAPTPPQRRNQPWTTGSYTAHAKRRSKPQSTF